MKRRSVAALACGLTAVTVSMSLISPAAAQHWRDRDRGDRVAAGVAGLAIGAGLAASAHADRDQWYRDNGRDPAYDDTFYQTRGYYPNDGYYASRYRDYDGCRVENRYDSYNGQPIQLRTCR